MNAESRLLKVLELDKGLNQIQDLDVLLELILSKARDAVRADAGSIYIVEDDMLAIKYSQNDTLTARLGPGEKLIYSFFKIPINDKTISGSAAATALSINVPDMYNIPEDAPYSYNPSYDIQSGYKTVSTLTFPLQNTSKKVIGVLQLINATDEEGNVIPFSEEDKDFLSHFATTASVAIQRAQMTRDILLRMIKMAEMRDPKETGAHVNRVGAYSAEIYERWARKHGHSEEEIAKEKDTLRVTAMLHDVGKVGISDTVLKKPGRFTPDERAIIQTHCQIGANLFPDDNSELDTMAREIALRHHENWDGSGYPGFIDVETGGNLKGNRKKRALKKEEIPLHARIVSLMDVFDALSCHRVYKEAWTEERVLSTLKEESGTKFDPEIVDIFFECLPVIRQIQARYPDESE